MLTWWRFCSGNSGRDRIVVSTSRCGRDNPGSNPGHGMPAFFPPCIIAISIVFRTLTVLYCDIVTDFQLPKFKTRWPSG